MTTWYRQVLSLIYGIGVMLIALWALQQGGGGATMILGVVGMSMLTLMLIFGVEIDTVDVSLDGFAVDFSDTSGGANASDDDNDDDEQTRIVESDSDDDNEYSY